ncbi:MAG TPA: alpha/beta fold hydrolase, partial [Candidatus Limnocylindria bacterium]|nr:alpha/beta fold hydrolase [Candidatus Limnocylindria bacterium]
MLRTTKLAGMFCTMLIWTTCASAQVKKQDADLTATDGVKIKVTYYSTGKPGPGVILLHQCNGDRHGWDGLAMDMAVAGINVLTIDNRGFGDSGGKRFDTATANERAAIAQKWPGDFDLAYAYLLNQPGMDKMQIGAGGASCGVDNATHLAHRHPEVKTLVLLSGPADAETIGFVRSATWMPILSAAAESDGDMLPTMRWIMGFARNPQDRLLAYKGTEHGTDMFKVQKELPAAILQWYEAKLPQPVVKENTKNLKRVSAIEQFWDMLMKPDGVARATKMYLEAKKKDPNVFLFPESSINLLGYQRIQEGKTKDAIEILKINELAYPRSANVYDSLGDAYLADHQNELALQYSEKALKVLAEYPAENAG